MKRLMWCMAAAAFLFVGAVARADGPAAPPSDKLVTVAYEVGDLVLTSRQRQLRRDHRDATASELRPDFGPIMDLLTASVAPDTWKRDDGDDGRVHQITPFFLNASLLVRATPAVHAEVAARLAQVRQLPAYRISRDEGQ